MAPTETGRADSGSVRLSIPGMSCQGCVSAVTRALSRVRGVSDAHVDLASAHARVWGTAPVEALLAAVQAAGYEASVLPPGAETAQGHGGT
jgi:Au+-exporting ATPase